MSMAQMAIRWILDFPAVGVVIPGATRAEQVAATAQASGLPPLGRELHLALRELYEAQVVQHIRGPY